MDVSIGQHQWEAPPNHRPTKQRSLRASFKLPVVPIEMQIKPKSGQPPVPVPKLLARMKLKDPEPQLPTPNRELDLVTDSPVIHRRIFKSTSNGLILIEETNAPSNRTSNLVHTRSLDNLLEGKGHVIVDFNQSKKSKYSRVVITASVSTLNNESLWEDRSGAPLRKCSSTGKLFH